MMKRSRGFTLIELLVVIAIISVLAVSAGAVGTSFLTRNNSKNAINELASKMRLAHLNAASSKNNSAWGVYVEEHAITLFSGDSYAGRDPVYDEKFTLSASVTISSAGEVVFEKVTGESTNASFTIVNNVGDSDQVSVNSFGIVDVN